MCWFEYVGVGLWGEKLGWIDPQWDWGELEPFPFLLHIFMCSLTFLPQMWICLVIKIKGCKNMDNGSCACAVLNRICRVKGSST